MMKRLFAAIALLAAGTTAAFASEPEFYALQADTTIVTFKNADVDYVSFAKIDPITGNATTDYASMEYHLSNGQVQRVPIASVQEVIVSDLVNTTDTAVDLGLSVKWRNRNLGAATPDEYGTLIGWGDPTGTHHEQYHVKNYGSYNSNKNAVLAFYGGVTPPDTIAGTSLDVATALLGPSWRLPTYAQYEELITGCSSIIWMTYRGVCGARFTGPSGQSIFLPAAGMRRGETMTQKADQYAVYWTDAWYGTSTSTSASKGEMAYGMAFGIQTRGWYRIQAFYRYAGASIRPVLVP